MHGGEVGVGLAAKTGQAGQVGMRLSDGRGDRAAEDRRSCGERDPVEEIAPCDRLIHAEPAVVLSLCHVFFSLSSTFLGRTQASGGSKAVTVCCVRLQSDTGRVGWGRSRVTSWRPRRFPSAYPHKPGSGPARQSMSVPLV